MRVIQLSDFHLRGDGELSFGVVDTIKAFRLCLDHVKSLDPQPDVIIVSGDLADNGNPTAYEMVRKGLEELSPPVYVLPGNHDKRELMLTMLEGFCPVKEDIAPYICYTLEDNPVRIVVFDSIGQGKHSAYFDPPVQEWLEKQLALYPDKPTLLFTHHPPFITGMGMMDEPFEGIEKLEEILKKYPNVRLCCGHIHRGIVTKWAGVVAVSSPPVSMTIDLDLSPEGGDTFVLATAGYTLHHYFDGQINSHFCLIPSQATFSGPHPFIGSENPK